MHTYAMKDGDQVVDWHASEEDPQAFTSVWQILADNSEVHSWRKYLSSFELSHRAPRHARAASVERIPSNDLVNVSGYSAPRDRHADHDVEMEMTAGIWGDALIRLNNGDHSGDLSSPWSPTELFLAGALWQKNRDASRDVF